MVLGKVAQTLGPVPHGGDAELLNAAGTIQIFGITRA